VYSDGLDIRYKYLHCYLAYLIGLHIHLSEIKLYYFLYKYITPDTTPFLRKVQFRYHPGKGKVKGKVVPLL